MSRESQEYEFARQIIKKEAKRPNAYSNNRKDAMIERVARDFGDKGLKEFVKEFKKELRPK